MTHAAVCPAAFPPSCSSVLIEKITRMSHQTVAVAFQFEGVACRLPDDERIGRGRMTNNQGLRVQPCLRSHTSGCRLNMGFPNIWESGLVKEAAETPLMHELFAA